TQQRRKWPALRCALLRWNDHAFGHDHTCSQHLPHHPNDPLVANRSPQFRQQPLMADPGEELLQVDVHHPVPLFRHVPFRSRYSRVAASPGSDPVTVPVEPPFVPGRQLLQQRLLYPAVFHVRNPESAPAIVPFRNPYPPHCLRLVLAGEHGTAKAFCSEAILALDILYRASVGPRCSAVLLYLAKGFPEVLIRDHTLQSQLPCGHGRSKRVARLRLVSCPARRSCTPCPLDIRGRLPSSLRDSCTVSRAFRYYAAIRLLSSCH